MEYVCKRCVPYEIEMKDTVFSIENMRVGNYKSEKKNRGGYSLFQLICFPWINYKMKIHLYYLCY